MSLFSATTPTFTEADERVERESLSGIDKVLLQRDIYGCSPDCDQTTVPVTPIVMERSLALLTEAMDALPLETKASYLEALQLAPLLIQHESPPLAFLQRENFNPWAAATRLAGYWTLRKLFFGSDRAFLPMTIEGAMQQDAQAFEEHSFVFPVEDDKHARPVMFWNRIRTSNVPRDVALRCMFYVLQRLALQEGTSTNGIVVLINYQHYDLRKSYDRILTKQLVALGDSWSGKTNAIHICTGPGRSIMEILLPVIKKIIGREYRLRMLVHSGSASDLRARFPDYGLTQQHVDVLYGPHTENMARARKWLSSQRE